MHIDGWGGLWIILPIVMIPMMMAFMYLMFVRGGGMFMRGGIGPPWQDSERDYREPAEFDEMKQDLA